MSKTKVILLENVSKMGTKHEVKEVASGYARNFLLPNRKAILATESNLAQVERWQANTLKEAAIQYDLFKKEIDKFADLTVTITAPANTEGHLYGSIHETDITEALEREHRLKVDPVWIKLSKPIKAVGDHQVKITPDLEQDKEISVEIKVVVEAE